MARPRGRRSRAAGDYPGRNRDERHPAPGTSEVHVTIRTFEPDADLRRSVSERHQSAESPGTSGTAESAGGITAADRVRLQPGRPDLLVHAPQQQPDI